MFPGGVVTMRGGWDSGLRGAGRQHEARLFQVLGGRAPVMREVALAWPSLNHGDTFVLDSGSVIFVWSGAESSGGERLAAAHLASKLRDKVGKGVIKTVAFTLKNLSRHYSKLAVKHYCSTQNKDLYRRSV